MLSDTLFDAVSEIEFYQTKYPELYDKARPQIDALKEQMRALQQMLDGMTPPGTPGN